MYACEWEKSTEADNRRWGEIFQCITLIVIIMIIFIMQVFGTIWHFSASVFFVKWIVCLVGKFTRGYLGCVRVQQSRPWIYEQE